MSKAVKPIDLAKLYLESYGSADWRVYDQILGEDVEYEDSGGSRLRGRESLVQSLKDWKEGFADGRVYKIRSTVSDGNMAVAEITWTGTHTDTLTSEKTSSTINQKLNPTGRTIYHDAVLIFEINGSKIGSIRHYYDMNDFMRQVAG